MRGRKPLVEKLYGSEIHHLSIKNFQDLWLKIFHHDPEVLQNLSIDDWGYLIKTWHSIATHKNYKNVLDSADNPQDDGEMSEGFDEEIAKSQIFLAAAQKFFNFPELENSKNLPDNANTLYQGLLEAFSYDRACVEYKHFLPEDYKEKPDIFFVLFSAQNETVRKKIMTSMVENNQPVKVSVEPVKSEHFFSELSTSTISAITNETNRSGKNDKQLKILQQVTSQISSIIQNAKTFYNSQLQYHPEDSQSLHQVKEDCRQAIENTIQAELINNSELGSNRNWGITLGNSIQKAIKSIPIPVSPSYSGKLMKDIFSNASSKMHQNVQSLQEYIYKTPSKP